jgi:toxin ParE1/3/4
MPRIVRSPDAIDDVHDIGVFIARDSLEQALKMVDRIDGKVKLLAEFPGLGQAREDLGSNYRTLPLKSDLIVYRPIEDGIEVLRVVHGRRNLRNLFHRRKP